MPEQVRPAARSIPRLPSLLKKAGYGTTLIGKWHLGGLPEYGPLKSGYDHYWGFRWGALDYFTHKYGNASSDTEDLWDGDVKVHEVGYLTDLMGDHAVKSIGEYAKAQQPFLLSLHFNAPHWPWEGPTDEAESRRIKALADRDGGSHENVCADGHAHGFSSGPRIESLGPMGRSRIIRSSFSPAITEASVSPIRGLSPARRPNCSKAECASLRWCAGPHTSRRRAPRIKWASAWTGCPHSWRPPGLKPIRRILWME